MKNLHAILFGVFMIIIPLSMKANNGFIDRIEPANWWVGMQNNKLQLLVHGKNISQHSVITSYQGITIEGIETSKNPNYLFVNLIIAPSCIPGNVKLDFVLNGKIDTSVQYPVISRKNEVFGKKGFNASDAIYLITPDRFANGDPTNDNVNGYPDKANRKNPDGRHGGDIKGISDHLEYIKDMGFTALWINPLLENNMSGFSYHGYAITDFYKIDPRYGSNEDYYNLVNKCHENGLKVIMDVVLNHCGSEAWWANDLPTPDWYHLFGEFTRTSYRASTLLDPNASDYDKKMFADGWFDKTMPDLNQANKYLATYLTQNIIWWIESANIDGIRLDTQPYSDGDFLNTWMKAIIDEYPQFTVVGEAWFEYEAFTAAYQKSEHPISKYKSNIQIVTDFPLCFAMHRAVDEKEGWSTGMNRIYNVLAHDFLYGSPMNNMIFLENHDLTRIFDVVKFDVNKYKMLVGILATMRGIPQFYYGSEILLKGDKAKGDGHIRCDMPGGWPGDTTNVFTRKKLSKDQQGAIEYTKRLLNWRKGNNIIATGALKHFVPADSLYAYARYNEKDTVLVIANNADKATIKPDLKRYSEVIKSSQTAKNIITGEAIKLSALAIPPKSTLILELE